MTTESMLVAAAFPNPHNAEAAVRELGGAGFGEGDVSLMYTDPRNVTREGLVSGALFGGVIGGLVGLLFPPLGVIVAAGPLVGTLASAIAAAGTTAVAGAAITGLANALLALGMPQEMATRFGGHVHKGDALVIVHTSREQAEQVRSILQRHNPRVAEEEQAGAPADSGAAVMPAVTRST